MRPCTAQYPSRLSVIFLLPLEIWQFAGVGGEGDIMYFDMGLYVYPGMLIWLVLIQGQEGVPER